MRYDGGWLLVPSGFEVQVGWDAIPA